MMTLISRTTIMITWPTDDVISAPLHLSVSQKHTSAEVPSRVSEWQPIPRPWVSDFSMHVRDTTVSERAHTKLPVIKLFARLPAVSLLGRRAGSPSNTTWPQPRSTSMTSFILIHPTFGHNRHGPKLGRTVPPFWGSHLTQYRLGWGLAPCQVAYLNPSSSLSTTYMEIWGLCPFRGEELGPHLTQYGLGRGLPACQVSSWSIQPFGHNAPTLHAEKLTERERQTAVR